MRLALITAALSLALAGAASGVIIDSGDGTGNTTAPSPGDCTLFVCADPGWSHIGIRTNAPTVSPASTWAASSC